MKKFWILFSLFILPLVFYIFLSKGIYKYSNLPILTKEVVDVNIASNDQATFINHLTVVCFLGSEMTKAKATLFNLNQTIYKRYYQKPYFQMVAIIPKDTKENYAKSIEELAAFTDISNWEFLYLDNEQIKTIYTSFQTPFQLDDNLYSPYAFIVDRELRLRGRKDDEDTEDGKLYGYNTRSVATLKDKMKDDIDIIYYQLKKSAEKEKRNKREI